MSPCAFLPWDSAFFGRRIGRVTGTRADAADFVAADEWAREQAVECLYFLAAFGDAASMQAAEAHGYRLVDLRVTYERPVAPVSPPASIRTGTPADRTALRAIASGAFGDTRFSRDPRFAARADALYEEWVDRALDGFADAVLVATDEAQAPSGFVCCHRRRGDLGEVGLTAVRADARGAGVGEALVTAALDWFQRQGLATAFVVTNGANIPAQRLYQRCGFLSSEVQVWYHRWLTEC